MAMIPTTPQNLAAIQAAYEKIQNLIINLSARYNSEREHEDINDYMAPIQKELPANFKITRMTKRPFGFEFNIGTDALYNMVLSGRQYKWTRLK